MELERERNRVHIAPSQHHHSIGGAKLCDILLGKITPLRVADRCQTVVKHFVVHPVMAVN